MRGLIRYLLPGLLLAVIVGCGGDDIGGTKLGDVSERMEIGQALKAANGSEVTVSGFLIVNADGNSRLCGALLESFPPQCGGDRIDLPGFEVSTVPNTKSVQFSEGGIRTVIWSDGSISVKGIREADGLREARPSSED